MDHLESLRNTIKSLEKRPGMYIHSHSGFEILSIYIQGIFTGFRVVSGINVEREISAWYQDKTDLRVPNLFWFAQFENEFSALSEKDRSSKLFQILDQFFGNKISK